MSIKNSDQLINSYFEGCLSCEDKQSVDKFREQSPAFEEEFEQLENVFDLLDPDNFLIDPPINLTDQIMASIAIKQSNFSKLNIVQIFAKSLIAAGILLFIINVVSFNFSIDNINVSNILLKMSSDISETIIKPFINLQEYINF